MPRSVGPQRSSVLHAKISLNVFFPLSFLMLGNIQGSIQRPIQSRKLYHDVRLGRIPVPSHFSVACPAARDLCHSAGEFRPSNVSYKIIRNLQRGSHAVEPVPE